MASKVAAKPARKRRRPVPPVSAELEVFAAELTYAGDRKFLLADPEPIKEKVRKVLSDAEFRLLEFSGRAEKKNYAQRLSESIAQKVANELRPRYPGIVPDEDGFGHESQSSGKDGIKKLDVNFSTMRSGLELGISIKTINFPDPGTKRYTKNVKRVDSELRAEAQDFHVRQPMAAIAVLLFMPLDAASDSKRRSSLKHAADVLASRTGRSDPHSQVSASNADIGFLGLYDDESGAVRFYAPADIPPLGTPTNSLSFAAALDRIEALHRARNPHHK